MKDDKKKTIIFRCDASNQIGWGHMVRDITIAQELKKNNKIIFASIKDPANSYIGKRKFKIFFKKKRETEKKFLERIKNILKPDIFVFDRKYPYSPAILKNLKEAGIRIIIIDNFCGAIDIADEVIFPTAHLDNNLLRKFLSPKKINKVKSGFNYILLRKEILKLRRPAKYNLKNPPNILLITGGSDPKGILLKLIQWLKEMNLNANITAFYGKSFKFLKELKKIKRNLPANFHLLPYSLKEIIKGDIAICTFGVSIYEMIYLGIPVICVAHSLENASGAKILKQKHRLIENMGYIGNVNVKKLYKKIKLLIDKNYYKEMVRRCDKLIDGKGTKRIAKLIINK